MKINTDNAGSGGPRSLLPPGEYLARISDASEAVSKAGNPMMVIDWLVDHGEFKGAEVREWITMMPNTAWKWEDLYAALGYTGEIDIAPGTLIGKRCEVIVRMEAYNGEEKPKIQGYNKPVGSDIPADPLSPAVTATATTNGEPAPF